MIYDITGKDNKTLKHIRSLKRKTARYESREYIAEGLRLVLEALEFSPDDIRCIVISESFFEKEEDTAEYAGRICNKIYRVSDTAFAAISDTDTPQGILAVMNMSGGDFDASPEQHFIAVLDGVSEPGNMGTVIRTAEAVGFDGLYLMKGCNDIYSPKTVRATMGSLFRMKFRIGCTADDILELKNKGFTVISTTPSGDAELETYRAGKNTAVVIGNEAHGVSREVLDISDVRLKITMDGMAESLNAAVAAGIVMHWLKLCRDDGSKRR